VLTRRVGFLLLHIILYYIVWRARLISAGSLVVYILAGRPDCRGCEEAGDCRLVIFLRMYNNNIRCDTRRYNTEIIIDRLSIAAVPTLLHPHTRPLTRTRDLFLTFTHEYYFSFFIVSLFWVSTLKGASNHYHLCCCCYCCYCCYCDVRMSDKG